MRRYHQAVIVKSNSDDDSAWSSLTRLRRIRQSVHASQRVIRDEIFVHRSVKLSAAADACAAVTQLFHSTGKMMYGPDGRHNMRSSLQFQDDAHAWRSLDLWSFVFSSWSHLVTATFSPSSKIVYHPFISSGTFCPLTFEKPVDLHIWPLNLDLDLDLSCAMDKVNFPRPSSVERSWMRISICFDLVTLTFGLIPAQLFGISKHVITVKFEDRVTTRSSIKTRFPLQLQCYLVTLNSRLLTSNWCCKLCVPRGTNTINFTFYNLSFLYCENISMEHDPVIFTFNLLGVQVLSILWHLMGQRRKVYRVHDNIFINGGGTFHVWATTIRCRFIKLYAIGRQRECNIQKRPPSERSSSLYNGNAICRLQYLDKIVSYRKHIARQHSSGSNGYKQMYGGRRNFGP